MPTRDRVDPLTSPLPAHFCALRSAPASGTHNMAVDLALMARARATGEGVWRCYGWTRPTISFGRNETVRGRFDADSVARAGLDAVRRPTGGRALLHGREVTYSVTVPIAPTVAWRQMYDAVNAVLVAGLGALGVPVSLVPHSSAGVVRPDGPVCFDHPAPGEIVVGGAKLVGSAVWRERGAYLQHGSILLQDDQATLASAMVDARAEVFPPAASLGAWFAGIERPAPTWPEVATALEHALARGCTATPLSPDAQLTDDTVRFEREIAAPDWLWRR